MSNFKRGRYELVLRHQGREHTREIFSEDGSDVDRQMEAFTAEHPEWQTHKPGDRSGNDIRWIGPE